MLLDNPTLDLFFRLASPTSRWRRIIERFGSTVVALDEWVGPGYSLPTPAMIDAVRTLARFEGILLAPVYTGKAMAGLIDLVRRATFKRGDNVLFLHTGGAPALYAYQRTLQGE